MITETGRIAEMLCAPFFLCFTEKQAEILVTIAPFRVRPQHKIIRKFAAMERGVIGAGKHQQSQSYEKTISTQTLCISKK